MISITMDTASKNAFTLVEIMIVVAIIGILSAVAIPNFASSQETAIRNTCLANIKQMETALIIAVSMASINVNDLSADGIKAIIEPDYMRMPSCKKGIYSTDGSGKVHCSAHLPDV